MPSKYNLVAKVDGDLNMRGVAARFVTRNPATVTNGSESQIVPANVINFNYIVAFFD